MDKLMDTAEWMLAGLGISIWGWGGIPIPPSAIRLDD